MKRNVCIIYVPKHIKIELASFERIDTEIDGFFYPKVQKSLLHQDLMVTN